jgi:AcrR family transcriptional regulator
MSESTQAKLLLSAMHLYGARGLHAVSLREISVAAGSRNSAAMHYHFKNKSGVIDAVLQFIFQNLRAIGAELGVTASARASRDLHQAIKLSLLPLVELRRRYRWGNDALQFLAQLMTESNPEIALAKNHHAAEFYRNADDYLARLLPSLPRRSRQLRLMFVAVNTFHGFAEVAALQQTPLGDLSKIDENTLLEELVSYLAGGLQAPNLSTLGDTYERSAI